MKKYFVLLCFTLFFLSCNHNKGKVEGEVLPPPSNLQVVATENVGELKLTWKQVSNNLGYEVSYKNTVNNEVKTLTTAKNKNNSLLTKLEGGIQYEISCKTKGDGHSFLDSPYSILVMATPKGEIAKLSIPASFKAEPTGNNGEVMLKWEAVQYASGYSLRYKKTASTDDKINQDVDSTKVSYLVSALENNVEYSFFIVAKGNGSTWLDSNESAEVKATPGNKLESPNNLKVFPSNEKGSLFAKWDTVQNNNGYTIKYMQEGGGEQTQDIGKDEKSLELKGLAQGKEYSVSIMTKSTSEYSPSDYSKVEKCTTLTQDEVIVLEKIEIEGQEDVLGNSFKNLEVNNDGLLSMVNPNTINFKITIDEKTIIPHFAGTALKNYEIYLGDGFDKKKLENNKMKFEKDKLYFLEILARNNRDLVVSYNFQVKALEGAFDVATLYLKGDYKDNVALSNDILQEIIESTEFQISPKLRNSKNLKLNVKKVENQKFLFLLFLSNDDEMAKVEFDGANAENAEVDGKKCYYKVLIPDSSGKATVNAKFTLKSGSVEDRLYEFVSSNKNLNTEIKAIVFGNEEFELVAMPSSNLAVFVPESYRGNTYPIKVKFENNATYNLYLFDDVAKDWKRVEEGSNLKIAGEDDEIMLDVIPEIGDGLYSWDEVSVEIIVGAKDVPKVPEDILIGNTSIKVATTKENAVAFDLKDIRNITIKLTDDDEFNEQIILCTAEEFEGFNVLSQRDKLVAEIEEPSQDDFSTDEGKEFVLILKHEDAEGYKDIIYHVWLKKK